MINVEYTPCCNYRLVLAYDGQRYAGWQSQQNAIAVQNVLDRVLSRIYDGLYVPTTGVGRTDAGVHACRYLVNFRPPPTNIRAEQLLKVLMQRLPPDICALQIDPVPMDYNCRIAAKMKHYSYFISRKRSPFWSRYSWQIDYPLDPLAMQAGAAYLLGKHDFTSFRVRKSDQVGSVRTISRVSVSVDAGSPLIRVDFWGKSFLHNMVRIMVGCLVDVGRGKHPPQYIGALLAARDRVLSGRTAPARGLFLCEVDDGTGIEWRVTDTRHLFPFLAAGSARI